MNVIVENEGHWLRHNPMELDSWNKLAHIKIDSNWCKENIVRFNGSWFGTNRKYNYEVFENIRQKVRIFLRLQLHSGILV